MATFTDNFNRANENPITTPWESMPAIGFFSGAGLQIVTNQLEMVGGGSSASLVTGESFDNDQSAEIQIVAFDLFSKAGVMLRGNTSGNGYIIELQKSIDDVFLRSASGGTGTLLNTWNNVGFSEGSTLKADIVGNVIRIFVNGVQAGADYTDT